MQEKKPIYVIGHKNPDTDSICSALSFTNLLKKLGKEAVAARAGEINKETAFALDYFKMEKPQLVTDVHAKDGEEKTQLYLVDHNEGTQTVDGADDARILGIIDHHRLGGLQTSEPLFMRLDKVGCTNTILTELYQQHKVVPSKQIAGLMLSAIISDTVLFKSPTCTERDKKAVAYLADIAGVDVQKYGMELLKAGSDVGNMSDEQIVKNDLKEFVLSGYRVIVSQTSVMDSEEILKRKDALLENMAKVCQKENYDMSLIMITNILTEATNLLFTDKARDIVKEAFGKETKDNMIYLPGVMSRKKQIIPQITEAAKKYAKN